MDVMNKEMLHVQVIRQNITQIYLLAAILSATGEKNPGLAWHLNMQGLLNILDIAREEKLTKVYWPSSIAVSALPHRNITVRSKRSLSLQQFMVYQNTPANSGALLPYEIRSGCT
jgi:nucleoside-diphosphate-sugar epimerase